MTSIQSSFTGFPPAGLQFLRELALNNNREWFQAHQQVYEQQLLVPARLFVSALGEKLETYSPGIEYDAASKTGGSILRLHRDVRFSRDKSPYHTQMRLLFWEGMQKKMENPGFFLVIEADGGTLHVGQYQFSPPHLQSFRQAVISEPTGSQLEEAIRAVHAAGDYPVGGLHYKKVPLGYPPGHPRAEMLKFNGLYASTQAIPASLLVKPELVDLCFEHCRNLSPLHRWLVEL